ncbi:hypothetical protein SAMN05192560_0776 [Methylobacillus rhizosphaerae]|uniref:Bbp19-like phage domain-containing protein n=1 Tax=Methylobacillus rhizosphaerae TaxID=551994 RepID=A0A238YSR0_9PROT|nr:endopeptidase [Methylobacillus rhizosphaerae]SNR73731.1 hypothetical protein SAMN05192560_0776 [Methylobacillus rhizosphaerae]
MNDYDPNDINGQQKIEETAERKRKVAVDQEVADFKWLMESKRGRRIVWGWLERCGVFRLSFNANSMTMAFNEGNRNLGLSLIAKIHALCPESYSVMVKENTNDDRNTDD